MTPLFKKLNFKDQPNIVVLNAPDTFLPEMEAMRAFTAVQNQQQAGETTFALAFATKQREVDAAAEWMAQHTVGDAICWIAYPKSNSKQYTCDFNRDTGWDKVGTLGFEPVRQVAIDEDWSALRFRRVAYIKTMTRSFALTDEGKDKAAPVSTPLTVPDDLAAALDREPAVKAWFEALSPSHRKEYLRSIAEAKRPETRITRIEKTLAAGRKS